MIVKMIVPFDSVVPLLRKILDPPLKLLFEALIPVKCPLRMLIVRSALV